MLLTFEECVEFVFAREGAPPGKDGYVNDPRDAGGETKFGIAKRSHPNLDIKNLTRDGAAKIYHEDYWMPAHCDDVSGPLRLAVFDTAVNCGVATSRALLQPLFSVDDYLFERLRYYIGCVRRRPKNLAFLPGWASRELLVREASQ